MPLRTTRLRPSFLTLYVLCPPFTHPPAPLPPYCGLPVGLNKHFTNHHYQVMIATTGAQLLPPEALQALHDRLLPLATIVTPNVPEALLLLRNVNTQKSSLDYSIKTVEDLETAARAIRALGPPWVLVKGGHCPFRADGTVADAEGAGDDRVKVVDVLVGEDPKTGEEVVVRLETEYCASKDTHGTGCSLACGLILPNPFILFFRYRNWLTRELRDSGDRVKPGKRDGHACGSQGWVSICPGRYQKRTGTGRWERAAQPFSLHVLPTVFAVSDGPHFTF